MVIEIVFEMTAEYQLVSVAEVGKIISLVGLAVGICSEVVLSDEEKSWQKGGDAVKVCDFGGAVAELCKTI